MKLTILEPKHKIESNLYNTQEGEADSSPY